MPRGYAGLVAGLVQHGGPACQHGPPPAAQPERPSETRRNMQLSTRTEGQPQGAEGQEAEDQDHDEKNERCLQGAAGENMRGSLALTKATARPTTNTNARAARGSRNSCTVTLENVPRSHVFAPTPVPDQASPSFARHARNGPHLRTRYETPRVRPNIPPDPEVQLIAAEIRVDALLLLGNKISS